MVVPPPNCAAAVPVHVVDVNTAPDTVKFIAVPLHTEKLGFADILGDKLLFTVTVICALGPSQLFTVCDTQKLNVPAVLVTGVGAVALPVPPVAAVYHFKLLPVAVNGVADEFTQYDGLLTVGADGVAFTVPVPHPCALGQLLTVTITQ